MTDFAATASGTLHPPPPAGSWNLASVQGVAGVPIIAAAADRR